MSISISFPFTDEINYTFDPTKIEVGGGKAKLKYQDDPVSFSQDFASSTGFTFDAAKTEFVGGIMRQKDTRPANSVFGSTFNSTKNSDWSVAGSGYTGVDVGSPTLSGGKLDCGSNAANGLYYDDAAIGNIAGVFTVRMKYTPSYNGAPPALTNIFTLTSGSNANRITVYHDPSLGRVRIIGYNSVGGLIHSGNIFGNWTPTSGTEYELEMDADISGTGTIRFFIDGVLLGAVTSIYTRATVATKMYLGYDGGYNASAKFDDVILFSTVQHTANYTAGYSISSGIYSSDPIALPAFAYSGVGHITAIDGFSATSINTPKYILNGEYHNGSAWTASNSTYAQANTAAEVLAAIATLPVADTIIVKVIFPEGNTLSSIDVLSITAVGQIYPTTNPSITPTTSIRSEGLEGFVATTSIAGSDNIKYILSKNGIYYYFSGGSWTISNETYAQSNTAAEVLANLATFTDTAVETLVKIFLHSADGSTSPDIDNLEVLYNFAGETPSDITLVTVWGYTADFLGENVEGAKIKVSLDPKTVYYGNRIFTPKKQTVLSNEIGYFEFSVADTDGMSDDPYYTIKVGNKSVTVKIPASPTSIALTDL